MKQSINHGDAFVISDYNYGVVDDANDRRDAEDRDVPVLVDSRFRLSEFAGFTAATPNEDEVENLIGAHNLIDATTRIRRKAVETATRLSRAAGHTWQPGHDVVRRTKQHQFIFRPLALEQAVDVTGAGDTVIATFALALASEASFADAARLANYAGGLVVMKRGTATVTATELEHSILILKQIDDCLKPRRVGKTCGVCERSRARKSFLRTAASTCFTSDTCAILQAHESWATY